MPNFLTGDEMKKLMVILLVALTSTAFAAKKLIIADIKRFKGDIIDGVIAGISIVGSLISLFN